jgi:alpha-methylacyl-CoA racemase
MPTAAAGSSPLGATRVVVLGGQGPVPFAAMVLADLGADVVRIDRRGDEVGPPPLDAVFRRGQRSLFADLKDPADRAAVRALVDRSDVLLEGFRPGVAERLGLGPDDVAGSNPGLVYGRVTGWGQEGPLAQEPGHDIDYIALAGLLGSIGRPGEPPPPPLNVAGDFGGGGLLLVVGVLSALLERVTSGRGQVVDAAMVDGVGLLMAPVLSLWSRGDWIDQRGANFMDGGAPFYRSYETSDGGHVAVGAVEAPFYRALLEGLGLDDVDPAAQWDRERWPEVAERMAAAFRARPRDAWAEALAGAPTCVAPVLTVAEVAAHPHHAARRAHVVVDGLLQPAPAPRFGRSDTRAVGPWARPGQHTDEILAELATGPLTLPQSPRRVKPNQ